MKGGRKATLPRCHQCHEKPIPTISRSVFCTTRCAAKWAEQHTEFHLWCADCEEWLKDGCEEHTDERKKILRALDSLTWHTQNSRDPTTILARITDLKNAVETYGPAYDMGSLIEGRVDDARERVDELRAAVAEGASR